MENLGKALLLLQAKMSTMKNCLEKFAPRQGKKHFIHDLDGENFVDVFFLDFS